MAVDIIARLMAMKNGGGGQPVDAYTKAETDDLLDGKADIVDGKVPAAQLPSYVDDTVEGYFYSGTFYEDAEHTTAITGERGKIYVDLTTNKSYRWTGAIYTRVDECPAFGETQGTIYEGNKGKANADAIAAIKDGSSIDSFADVETALASKQATLTTAQQNAVNSGIDSTKVDQIATNATDIATITPALVKQVDDGAKNFLKITATSQTINGVTFTVNDDSISLSGTATANITSFYLALSAAPSSGTAILSGCPSGGGGNKYQLDIVDGERAGDVRVVNYSGGTIFDWADFTSGMYTVRIRIANGQDCNGLVFKPMLCAAADWAVSQKFVPYAPTNRELYEMIKALQS